MALAARPSGAAGLERGANRSGAGWDSPLVALLWAVAEATVWPIMPDAILAPLALTRPAGWWRLALSASLGTLLGGALSYAAGRRWPARAAVERLPLVRPSMVDAVDGWLACEGPRAVLHQPFSGVPFKVFARRAGAHAVPVATFLGWSVAARVPRFLAASGLAALLGWRLGWLVQPRARALTALWAVVFGIGLWRTVLAWERRGGPPPARA